METFLLTFHVIAGILFVGPIAVAVSLFPRYAPVTEEANPSRSETRNGAVAAALHRITRVYGVLALAVPVAGMALALVQNRMGEVWIVAAMVMTAVAGALLALQIVPRQRDALESPGDGSQLRRTAMLSGVFNLLWAAVVVMMIVRPGSDYS
jgi:hypothetical protein